jgi:uncharacterized protein
MLLSFSVSNFRSFNTEQTLNLIASKRFGENEGSPHCSAVPGTDEHALRIASLYGANGAGKSNLVRAITLMQEMVLTGAPPKKILQYDPFVLGTQEEKAPITLDVLFFEENDVYRYGICFDMNRVHEEWLNVYEEKKEKCLFRRVSPIDAEVIIDIGKSAMKSAKQSKIDALSKVGARPNQLFLTEIVNLDDPEAQGEKFRNAVQWFRNKLIINKPDRFCTELPKLVIDNKQFAEFAGNYLRAADTGISNITVQSTDVKKYLGLTDILDSLHKRSKEKDLSFFSIGYDLFEETSPDDSGDKVFRSHRIMSLHKTSEGKDVKLDLLAESDGSQRILHLLPSLYKIFNQGGIFVIDELERSMHPMLARKFVEYFLKAAKNKQSQLIFTTHETTLLDLDIMRRDGIWFAEKNKEGETNLYSLADFKARKDLRIDKGYMAGRFGAVPFLGGIDRLMEQEAMPETSGA